MKFAGGGNTGTERGQSTGRKRKYEYQVHNTYIPVPGTSYFASYLLVFIVLLKVRNNAQRSTTQHRTAGQGTAPHGIARRCAPLRCAAELHIAGLSLAGGAFFVIHQCNIYKPGVNSSSGTWYDTSNDTGMYERVSTAKARSKAKHGSAPHRIAPQDTALHLTAPHGAADLS